MYRVGAEDSQLKHLAQLVIIILTEESWFPLSQKTILFVHQKDGVAQMELPQKHGAVQVTRCRKGQSVTLLLEGSRENSCVRSDHVDSLFSLVAELE